MADFLDRYGEQLRLAQLPTQRRSRAPRKAGIAALLILAVTAPAVAVVQPWSPTLGRPQFDGRVSIDRSPVDRSATDVLAILRRPQTARDRELATPRLKYAGGMIDNVQVDGIRALNERYALVPITSLDDPGGPPSGAMLCLLGGGGAACSPVSSVAEHGVIALSGGPNGTHYVGVVPDGVTRVRFTPDDGTPAESVVSENFFELRVPAHGPTNSIRAPAGWKGPTDDKGMIPGPVGPAHGELEWLDVNGKVVGPQTA
jgi:hypothetical protein